MNKLIQQNLENILGMLNDLMASGISVVKANLPILLQQILAYGQFRMAVLLVISLIVLVLAIVFIVSGLTDKDGDPEDLFSWGVLFGIPSFITAVISASIIVKIHIAPLLYLMEQVRHLVR